MANDSISWNDPHLKRARRIISEVTGVAEDGLAHEYVIEAMFTDSIIKALNAAFAGQCVVSLQNPKPGHCWTVKEFLIGIRKQNNND